jgi:serine/threonine protein phosphatase 1
VNFFGRLLNGIVGNTPQTAAITAEILVMDPFDGPVYAVGDVHGCYGLYRDLEAAILRDAANFSGPATIVLLGDMVDRGPQSAALIDHLIDPLPGTARRLCLMGNHEAMMLDFLAAPGSNTDWLYTGGHETLLSYGVTLDVGTLGNMNQRKLQQTLAAHLPEHHLAFLRQSLAGLQVGPYLLAHAGADAAAPLTAQPLQSLLWGSTGLTAPDGLTLIHGHYVALEPSCHARCIGIDTGAFATGRLTALRILDGQPPAVLTLPSDQAFRQVFPMA